MSNDVAQLSYAGFWRRLLAWLIDTILLGVITVPLLMLFYGVNYMEQPLMFTGPAHVLIAYGLPPVVTVGFWIRMSTTPGKMVIGAVVVDARTGGKPTPGQFVLRYLGCIVSALVLGLGYLWIAFDPRKQGLHDKMSGTVVVRRKLAPVQLVQFEEPVKLPG